MAAVALRCGIIDAKQPPRVPVRTGLECREEVKDMRNKGIGHLAPWLLVSLALVAPEAWAYLDPSTGSMILSAIVGVFATAALAVKTFWYKLKGLFRGKSAGTGEATAGRQAQAPQATQAAESGEPPVSRN